MTPTSATPVDLRSDTVTRPTAAMRRAIAEAVVGDDVLGDDPTVLALQERVAALAGKEAALFVPSGTMGNQLAVHVLIEPSDEVLLEEESHIFLYEQGALAANSGGLAHVVKGERGALPVEALIASLRPEDVHASHVKLVCVENTHNRAGGAIVPLERLREVAVLARERGWKRILLVTSATHMRRAAAVFRTTTGLEIVPVPCSFLTQASIYGYDTIDLVPQTPGFAKLDNYVHEQVGWWVYRWRGWISAEEAAK